MSSTSLSDSLNHSQHTAWRTSFFFFFWLLNAAASCPAHTVVFSAFILHLQRFQGGLSVSVAVEVEAARCAVQYLILFIFILFFFSYNIFRDLMGAFFCNLLDFPRSSLCLSTLPLSGSCTSQGLGEPLWRAGKRESEKGKWLTAPNHFWVCRGSSR